MKATSAPATKGAMLYHSMLIQVPTCPTSLHQLYSMMKLAAVVIAQRLSANIAASTIRFRIFEGCIRDRRTLNSGGESMQGKHAGVRGRS